MENNDYKYKSINVLKDWSVKRLSNIPKTFYYGFLFSVYLKIIAY